MYIKPEDFKAEITSTFYIELASGSDFVAATEWLYRCPTIWAASHLTPSNRPNHDRSIWSCDENIAKRVILFEYAHQPVARWYGAADLVPKDATFYRNQTFEQFLGILSDEATKAAKSYPDITIAGYKAKFKDGKVHLGCQSFGAAELKRYLDILDTFQANTSNVLVDNSPMVPSYGPLRELHEDAGFAYGDHFISREEILTVYNILEGECKKPKIHNPQKVALETIPPGWRLLYEDEIKSRLRKYPQIQLWAGRYSGWSEGWRGDGNYTTYITSLSREELAKLP